MKTLGQKIREKRLALKAEECKCCRQKVKLSNQQRMADFVGVSRGFISMIENDGSNINSRTLALISIYLKTPLEELVESKDKLKSCKEELNKLKELLSNNK